MSQLLALNNNKNHSLHAGNRTIYEMVMLKNMRQASGKRRLPGMGENELEVKKRVKSQQKSRRTFTEGVNSKRLYVEAKSIGTNFATSIQD